MCACHGLAGRLVATRSGCRSCLRRWSCGLPLCRDVRRGACCPVFKLRRWRMELDSGAGFGLRASTVVVLLWLRRWCRVRVHPSRDRTACVWCAAGVGCRLMEPPVDDINVVVAKVAQVRPGLLVPCGAMRAHAWGAARDHPRATATPPTHRRCRTRACSSARSRCLGTAWGRCWRT